MTTPTEAATLPLPPLALYGYATFPPPVRRATVSGRVLWGLVGFAAAFMLAGPLVMLMGRHWITDLLPFLGLLLGVFVLARRNGRLTRPEVREVSLGLGHSGGLLMMLAPDDHEALARALHGWYQTGQDRLIRYQTAARSTEFRLSDVQMQSVLNSH